MYRSAQPCALPVVVASLVMLALVFVPATSAMKPSDTFHDMKVREPANLDEIVRVPGFHGSLTSKHYAGYVNVDADHDKNLFYYFVESEKDPATAPVVLWLNGGPGCSSLDGLIYEHGPFKFAMVKIDPKSPSVQLTENPYAWSKVANMLYLDSPAGVGMSYSGDTSDYVTNDTKTAADADAFLRGWFQKYPQYQSNSFYISGESYAGIYVPLLSRAVLRGNRRGISPAINLVGYLVGNGCTDEAYDSNALPPFAVGKSLIGMDTYHAMHEACGGVWWPRTPGGSCDVLIGRLMRSVSSLNLYDVLETCYHETDGSNPSGTRSMLVEEAMELLGGVPEWPMPGTAPGAGKVVRNWASLVGGLKGGGGKLAESLKLAPPCINVREASLWLNSPFVRAAIHAAPIEKIGKWEICSDKIQYTHDAGSMFPVHMELTGTAGLRALIYSGDHDMCVPHTGTETWTRALGRKVLAPWQPWFYADQQVAGYMVEYEGLTYATIKGAGHMVPQTNPEEALEMFKRFIDGESLVPPQLIEGI